MAFIGMVFVFVIIAAFIITPVILILSKVTFFAVGSLFLRLIPPEPSESDESGGKPSNKVGYIVLGIVVFTAMLFALHEFFAPLGISLLFLMSSQMITCRMKRHIIVFLRVLGAVFLITGLVLLGTGYSLKEQLAVVDLLARIGG